MLMMKQPPAQPQSTHRVHRAGTGLDAPKTDKALAMGGQQIPLQPPIQAPEMKERPLMPQEPVQEKSPQTTPEKKTVTEKTPTKPKESPSRTFTSPSGKVPMQRFFQDAIDEAERTEQDIKTNKKSLSFLSPQNIYQAMRQRATEMTASSPGVAEQYGEFKYLHYNQKVYQALQQSMSIIANRLSQQQHDMLLHNIQHPTRIRFALDQQGQLKGIAIILASGNPAYDSLAYQIVKEASYPPIPKSFNMHTTYHTYGIVLYYNGVPQDNFGVSPYLEGE
ncbi:MAG: hypothetical protein US13_C0011G0028 [candidate division TM6 bacterium GW2011_GWE2_36_25]|nr:MAG: hypothetical protein US03_C0007G0006 [candidate division TM6 bacterium GW2011_GWF2_36_131]KKQ02720.1 MAG: hypothetical protein US13_C0011G0028 [candidate division TM6 bacterium GW2011_GWE2_36_25]KKQ19607.1 MAG: hypothetical protein US32_C0007G0060 [candidate division TM6 bacterium GW2011_GWA2_36_9]